jgi:endonuclease III
MQKSIKIRNSRSRMRIEAVLDLLRQSYGPRFPAPKRDPTQVLVETILSQNTSDANSARAFQSLMTAFSNWDNIADADVNDIARAIETGGLGRIKAPRIKTALNEIRKESGKIDLSFLDNLTIPEALEWLKKLPGVGDKTANCVLLFSAGRPALPVDTHIFRVSRRLGVIKATESVEQAHHTLAGLVPDRDVYAFHVLMIEHGRKTCLARRPRCPICRLKEICPSFDFFSNQPAK